MNKAISSFTVIGTVTNAPSFHTAKGSGNPYAILRVLNDEQTGGKFEFFCGTEWIQKKLADVREGMVVCVKGRLGVNVNSNSQGGEFHNVNLTAEDVVVVSGGFALGASTNKSPVPQASEEDIPF